MPVGPSVAAAWNFCPLTVPALVLYASGSWPGIYIPPREFPTLAADRRAVPAQS